MGQYGEVQNDYSKYYYDNAPYRMLPQNSGPSWAQPHKVHEVGGLMEDAGMAHLENLPVGSMPGQDYYYEEARSRGQTYRGQHPLIEQKIDHKIEGDKLEGKYKQNDEGKQEPPTSPPVTSTSPKGETHISHRKIVKLTVESKMKDMPMETESDGHSARPSGAILTLAIGLCLSFIMIFYVGCRLRVIRRRMRRGGKSPYAHDADFLVNGMYL